MTITYIFKFFIKRAFTEVPICLVKKSVVFALPGESRCSCCKDSCSMTCQAMQKNNKVLYKVSMEQVNNMPVFDWQGVETASC